ncbi:MAG: hypothetical protein O2812_01105 [Chloroflexi bacterium]|nr:hypothetical protein [Chloroflexota bacterium]
MNPLFKLFPPLKVITLATLGIMLLAACNSASTPVEGATPTATPTGVASPGPTSTPTATPFPQSAPLPTREIAVRVRVPENTPADEVVYFMIRPFMDWSWSPEQRVALNNEGNGIWSGAASVEEGALVQYIYDRWDQQEWGEFTTSLEAHGETVEIDTRFLLVTPGVTGVMDVIETWNDHRAPASTGRLTGTVIDASTGRPLMDANVTVGGIHTATDYGGNFTINGIAAGEQRVTVYTNLGGYTPVAALTNVPESGDASVHLEVRPVQMVPVTFDVALPDETPEELGISVVGSVFQLGARASGYNRPLKGDNFYFLQMERIRPNHARATVELPENAYIQYFYTSGSFTHGVDKRDTGSTVYRTMVVSGSAETRYEEVKSWRNIGAAQDTFKVQVPPNTTQGAPIY